MGRQDSRWARVVTMDGQLIAESGTMSGGGNKQLRGRMRLGSAAPGAGAGELWGGAGGARGRGRGGPRSESVSPNCYDAAAKYKFR